MKFKARRKRALRMGATVADAWRFKEGRTCWWCGVRVIYGARNEPNEATREHLVPVSMDGSGARSNIVVACRSCNNTRNRDMDWVPFHWLNAVDAHIPRRQWEHLEAIGQLPARVAWKKEPA